MTEEEFKHLYRRIISTLGIRAEDMIRMEKKLMAADQERRFLEEDVTRLRNAIKSAIGTITANPYTLRSMALDILREVLAEEEEGKLKDQK